MKSLVRNTLKRLRLMHDQWVDRSMGINTVCHLRETPSGTANEDAQPYLPPAWKHVRLMLGELQLGPEDVFVDYGCGAGRILCEAARSNIARAVGVEFSKPLVEVARKNLEDMKGRNSPFEIHEGDAAQFEPRDCTVAFFFNPFGPTTMAATLDHLENEARRSGRDIRILYLNAECKALFDERPSIRETRVLKWSAFRFPAYMYTLSANPGS